MLRGKYAGTAHDKIVIVGAHYDTTSRTKGVDDNGSGVTALLQVAKQIGMYNLRLCLEQFRIDRSYSSSRKNGLELIEIFSINKVSLVQVSSCGNTGSIGDDPYWTSRKNSLELIELSNIDKVSLVSVSSCSSNTGSI